MGKNSTVGCFFRLPWGSNDTPLLITGSRESQIIWLGVISGKDFTSENARRRGVVAIRLSILQMSLGHPMPHTFRAAHLVGSYGIKGD
ncbi:hypothetical protein VNO77_03814 [Canavalia gladiata]|uniref:Uncharacterized protein n=1 Tax=Canavalia gladiata TaxID=3824 RepID=A0AAN9MVD3_CANGL